jgi:alpha-L-fucosidase
MIALKGIIGTPFRIRMIGTQDTLSWFVRDTALWNEIPGIIYILTPKPIPDPFASVVAIDFDRPIRIYYK